MESEYGKSNGRARSLARRFLATSKDSTARNNNAADHSAADNDARIEKQAATRGARSSVARREEYIEASGSVDGQSDSSGSNMDNKASGNPLSQRKEIVEASGGTIRRKGIKNNSVRQRKEVIEASGSVIRNNDAYWHRNSAHQRQEIVEASGGVNRMADVMCVDVYADMQDVTNSVKNSQPRRQEVVEASGGRNRVIAVMGVDVSADELESTGSRNTEHRRQEFVEASGGRNRHATLKSSNGSDTLDSSLATCDSGSNRREIVEASGGRDIHRSTTRNFRTRRTEVIEASGVVNRKGNVKSESDKQPAESSGRVSGARRREVVEASGTVMKKSDVGSSTRRKEVIEATGVVGRKGNSDASSNVSKGQTTVPQQNEFIEASGVRNRDLDVEKSGLSSSVQHSNTEPQTNLITDGRNGIVASGLEIPDSGLQSYVLQFIDIVPPSELATRTKRKKNSAVHEDNGSSEVVEDLRNDQKISQFSGSGPQNCGIHQVEFVAPSEPVVQVSTVPKPADNPPSTPSEKTEKSSVKVSDAQSNAHEPASASSDRNSEREQVTEIVAAARDAEQNLSTRIHEPLTQESADSGKLKTTSHESDGRIPRKVPANLNSRQGPQQTRASGYPQANIGSNNRDPHERSPPFSGVENHSNNVPWRNEVRNHHRREYDHGYDERDPLSSSSYYRSSSNDRSRDPRSSHYSRGRDPRYSESRVDNRSFKEQPSFSRREEMRSTSADVPPNDMFEEDERPVSHGWKPSIFDDDEDMRGGNRNRYQNNRRNNNGWQPNRKRGSRRNNNRFFNYREERAENNHQDSMHGTGNNERSEHASGQNVGNDGDHRFDGQNRSFVIDRNSSGISDAQQNKRGLNERGQSPEAKRTRPGDGQGASTDTTVNPSGDEETTNLTMSDQTTSVEKSTTDIRESKGLEADSENAKSSETPSKKSRYVLLNEMMANELNEEQLRQEPIRRMEYDQRRAREAEELRKDRERADRDVLLGEDSCDEAHEPKSLAGIVEGAKSVQNPWSKTEQRWNGKGPKDKSPGEKNSEPFSFRLTLDDPENRMKFAEADRERRGPARKRKGLGSKTLERDGVVRKLSGPVETSVPTGSFDISAWEKCRQDILSRANANSGSNAPSDNSPTTPTGTELNNDASNATCVRTQSQDEADSPEITPVAKGDEVNYQHDCVVVFRYSQLPDKFRWRACRKEMLVDAVKAKLPDGRFYEFNLNTSGNAVRKLLDGDFSSDTWETLKFRAIAEEYKNAIRRVANVRKRRNKKNKKNFFKFGGDHNYDQSHFRGRSWRQPPSADLQNEPRASTQNNSNNVDYSSEQPGADGRRERASGNQGRPNASGGEDGAKEEDSQVLGPAMAARYVRNANGNQQK